VQWPKVQDSNIATFLSFIQSDGFNPLTVNGDSFQVVLDSKDDDPSPRLNTSSPLYQTAQKIFSLSTHRTPLSEESSAITISRIASLLSAPWRPGQLLNDLQKLKLEYPESIRPTVLITAVAISTRVSSASYSVKGFWADHWTYLLDLVEAYLDIFPENELQSLHHQQIPFHMSPAVVKKRCDRYSMAHSSFSSETPQEISARYQDIDLRDLSPSPSPSIFSLPANISIQIISTVCNAEDSDKDLLKSTQKPCYPVHRRVAMSRNPHWQLDLKTGTVTKVSVIGKFFLLGILKFSTLDPFGMGIEMEGRRGEVPVSPADLWHL
jgi:hypothetical protein